MEAEQLYQLEGQLMEAIGLLKDVVETLRELEPNAASAIKAEVLKIFDDDESPQKQVFCKAIAP